MNSIPCKVTAPNGDTYETEFFGIFQFTDSEGSYPVAVVKFRNGKLGRALLSAVEFPKPTHFHTKDGKRVEIE